VSHCTWYIEHLRMFFVFINITIFLPQPFIYPVSKTHWPHFDTILLCWQMAVACCASSQVSSISFRSWRMVSIRFVLGLPGFHFVVSTSQYRACYGRLLSSMHKTCPSHLSLLSLTINSSFCTVMYSLTFAISNLVLPSDTCYSSLELMVSCFQFFLLSDRPT